MMNDNYKIAYQEAIQKFGEHHPYLPMVIVSLYGLLNQFEDYQDIVLDVFHKTKIIIEEGTIPSIMKKHYIDLEDYYDGKGIMNSNQFFVPAVSNNGKFLLTNYRNEIELYQEEPFIVCGETNHVSKTILLHSFIHEFCHLIKSHVNNYQFEEDEIETSHYLRCGLCYYQNSILKKDGSFHEGSYFASIDEVINVIQTTQVLEKIQGLDGIVPHQEVQDYLDQLNKNEMKKDYGYEKSVKEFRPLWEIDSFRSLIEDNIVEGNFTQIVEGFQSLCSNHTFLDLAIAIYEIDDLKDEINDCDPEQYQEVVQQIYQNIKNNIKVKKRK